MIIKDTVILPNGEVEVVDIEVADNYYDQPTPEPSTEETMLELLADQEYRLCMIELGL